VFIGYKHLELDVQTDVAVVHLNSPESSVCVK